MLGALGAGDPRPNASLQAVIDACPAPEGWRTTGTLPFSSARKYSGASLDEGDATHRTWLLGAPDVLLRPGAEALAETDALNERGLRVLLLSRAAGGLDGPGPGGRRPGGPRP